MPLSAADAALGAKDNKILTFSNRARHRRSTFQPTQPKYLAIVLTQGFGSKDIQLVPHRPVDFCQIQLCRMLGTQEIPDRNAEPSGLIGWRTTCSDQQQQKYRSKPVLESPRKTHTVNLSE